MADLLSLFRGTKPGSTTPKTTPTAPTAPIIADPDRSGNAPIFVATTEYEVVVPPPAPIRSDQPIFNAPGSSGVIGVPDTTGMRFAESSSATRPPALPALFFMVNGGENIKTTVDAPLAERLYEMFKKGRD